MVKPTYTDIEYEEHKQYMRDRYHRIQYKMKNKIKEPPIVNIFNDRIVLEFI
jgi:hypothetical protein